MKNKLVNEELMGKITGELSEVLRKYDLDILESNLVLNTLLDCLKTLNDKMKDDALFEVSKERRGLN